VETQDSKNKKRYRQVWKNNMSTREEPKITDYKDKEGDFTCVTFRPDLKIFKMDHLDEDIVSLMTKRVYDMAGTTPS